MANPLTASLTSSRGTLNAALPGDTVSFKFSSPPPSVTAVEIDIQQAQFQQGGVPIPGGVLATFEAILSTGNTSHAKPLDGASRRERTCRSP